MIQVSPDASALPALDRHSGNARQIRRTGQPIDGDGDVLIDEMRNHHIRWYGTILHSVNL